MSRQTTVWCAVLAIACLAPLGSASFATAADLSGRPSVASASADEISLAAELGSSYQVHLSENFAFVFDRNEDFIRAGTDLLERTRNDFYDLYREAGFQLHKSNQRNVWICFSTRNDFQRYAERTDRSPLSWLSEYYSARTNRVTIVRQNIRSAPPANIQLAGAHDAQVLGKDASATTNAAAQLAVIEPVSRFNLHPSDVTRLTHESAHQFSFNSGLLTRGVMYPLWVAEGLATHFEADDTGLTGRGSLHTSRRERLASAHRRGTLQPLSEFISVVKPPQGGDAVGDAYAQSWGL